jgi:two-component system LytT family response regulator
MIRAILLDDEKHCNVALQFELDQHCPEIEIVGVTQKVEEAADMIERLAPDLLFLDIEMPWISGFEFLEKLGQINFDVIFVTGNDQYAVQAFKYAAVHYLLKPVDGKELKLAVDRIQQRPNLEKDQFQLLMSHLNTDKQEKRIALPTQESIEYVLVDDIIRCEAEGNYCSIYLVNNKKIFLAKTLKDIESLLVNKNFLRVHNSHLISISQVKRYLKANGGELEMTDSSLVPLARARKNEILETLKFQ